MLAYIFLIRSVVDAILTRHLPTQNLSEVSSLHYITSDSLKINDRSLHQSIKNFNGM